MTRTIGIKIICVATALILALASIFGVAKLITDPAFYQKSIAALEEKQETVLELTAASTAASAAITLLPGDTATPIADKLADLSGYFLIVLCAIFLEKYLLTITAAAAFKVLIPAACAAFAAAALFPRLRRTAGGPGRLDRGAGAGDPGVRRLFRGAGGAGSGHCLSAL